MSNRNRAFTLVELLVVIAIIGVLVALLLPAVQASREAGRRAACSNNLRQMGIALTNYEETNGAYPSSSTGDLTVDWDSGEQHSWASRLLPYLESANLADAIDFEAPLETPGNLRVAETVVPIYRCPAYSGPTHSGRIVYNHPDGGAEVHPAIGNYVAFSATDVPRIWEADREPDGVIYPQAETRARDVTDGLTNTVLIVESREQFTRAWMDGIFGGNTAMPYDRGQTVVKAALNATPYYVTHDGEAGYFYTEYGPSSEHPGGAFHLFGDGGVRFLDDGIDVVAYAVFCTRAGGDLDEEDLRSFLDNWRRDNQ